MNNILNYLSLSIYQCELWLKPEVKPSKHHIYVLTFFQLICYLSLSGGLVAHMVITYIQISFVLIGVPDLSLDPTQYFLTVHFTSYCKCPLYYSVY